MFHVTWRTVSNDTTDGLRQSAGGHVFMLRQFYYGWIMVEKYNNTTDIAQLKYKSIITTCKT